ncbi:hypothetical protein P691DRAFT_774100 [Macrolepiota fuliginosa MF-IS2]|uniref:Uncharacterized protein n=1 Tax=Macrolepiota fuliginosa MF-IS2 TaxID=1400762 RepID=A0A9P5XFW3_9AGAR|nr:hypothetical protein P691DRAFT_774100 [Macrolepiota fuliginosa MF-IS2]
MSNVPSRKHQGRNLFIKCPHTCAYVGGTTTRRPLHAILDARGVLPNMPHSCPKLKQHILEGGHPHCNSECPAHRLSQNPIAWAHFQGEAPGPAQFESLVPAIFQNYRTKWDLIEAFFQKIGVPIPDLSSTSTVLLNVTTTRPTAGRTATLNPPRPHYLFDLNPNPSSTSPVVGSRPVRALSTVLPTSGQSHIPAPSQGCLGVTREHDIHIQQTAVAPPNMSQTLTQSLLQGNRHVPEDHPTAWSHRVVDDLGAPTTRDRQAHPIAGMHRVIASPALDRLNPSVVSQNVQYRPYESRLSKPVSVSG